MKETMNNAIREWWRERAKAALGDDFAEFQRIKAECLSSLYAGNGSWDPDALSELWHKVDARECYYESWSGCVLESVDDTDDNSETYYIGTRALGQLVFGAELAPYLSL